MEYDIRKAERVWQRVQADGQETAASRPGDHLPALIMEQLQLAETYRQLAYRSSGRDGAMYMGLARESKAQAVCLKGILKLVTEKTPEIGIAPQQIVAVDVVLRRCYGQELRLMKEYENRRADSEYGPVYERMAARSREHCCMLLELIGRTGK